MLLAGPIEPQDILDQIPVALVGGNTAQLLAGRAYQHLLERPDLALDPKTGSGQVPFLVRHR
jgi:hypothetical protein